MSKRRHERTVGKLSNGLQAVHQRCRGSAVGIFGLCVKAGSRNDPYGGHGLAHFVEHTIFKGTGHRRSSHIINRMEAVGGELNAYTTKEETVIYSVFPAAHLSRAAELIADLAHDSRFPERELAKEREVVADEIDSYLDTPSEAIYDDFEDLMFAGSPLGHNILGDRMSLKRFDCNTCRKFLRRNYRADNMVAFYSGPRGAEAVFGLLDRYLSVIGDGGESAPVPETRPRFNAPFDEKSVIATHQSHCIVGARIGSYLDDSRYATALLTNLTGGPGMNSLLNVELRERRGLVYNVEASTALFSDCGLMTVYFGCDPSDSRRCRDIVMRCFDNLSDSLTAKRIEAAKKQYLGQLVISSESRESSILEVARSLLWRGRIADVAVTEEMIGSISKADLLDVAEVMNRPSILTFSPE